MPRFSSRLLFVTALFLASSLALNTFVVPIRAAEPDPATVDRARAAARALGGELMKKLASELREGGTAAAVRVCSEVAQETADAHSTDTMTVRRVSLKVRNLADRPDAYERQLLEELHQDLRDGGELPEEIVEVVEEDGERTLRYLRPIRVMSLCLQCHGAAEELDIEVVKVLEERYPDDEATGYSEGDLRGAVSVKMKLE